MSKNFVVKLAQPGFDVKTAGDENLIYNSNWPLLKIYKQGQWIASNTAGSPTIATHDLGFIPMYWVFSNLPLTGYDNISTAADNRAEFFGPTMFPPRIYANKLKYQDSGIASLSAGYQSLYYYIFALDLTKQFTAPVIKVGAVGGKAKKSVFKIAKPTKDVNSSSLEDFVIHSKTRSPLIHSVNPGIINEPLGAAGYGFTVYHNLGYNPMFFGYLKNDDGSYNQVATGSGGSTIFQADEQKIRFQQATSGQGISIVILKDPFTVDYSVSVSI